MKQAQLLKVIDEWSEAIAALGPDVPAEKIKRLNAATGNLLTAFAENAMDLATGAAASMRAQLAALTEVVAQEHQLIEALDARTERRQQPRDMNSGE